MRLLILIVLILRLLTISAEALPLRKVAEYTGKTVIVTVVDENNKPSPIIGKAIQTTRIDHSHKENGVFSTHSTQYLVMVIQTEEDIEIKYVPIQDIKAIATIEPKKE